MGTLLCFGIAEILFWLFFTKKAAYFHSALLLVTVRLVQWVIYPVIRSVILHIFWRIPEAIIHKHFQATVKKHFTGWFGNPYKVEWYQVKPRHEKVIPIKEPGKRDLPEWLPSPAPTYGPQNPSDSPVPRIDAFGMPIDDEAIVALNMRKIDREIESFYRENGEQ